MFHVPCFMFHVPCSSVACASLLHIASAYRLCVSLICITTEWWTVYCMLHVVFSWPRPLSLSLSLSLSRHRNLNHHRFRAASFHRDSYPHVDVRIQCSSCTGTCCSADSYLMQHVRNRISLHSILTRRLQRTLSLMRGSTPFVAPAY
jgi:hypothetical protein